MERRFLGIINRTAYAAASTVIALEALILGMVISQPEPTRASEFVGVARRCNTPGSFPTLEFTRTGLEEPAEGVTLTTPQGLIYHEQGAFPRSLDLRRFNSLPPSNNVNLEIHRGRLTSAMSVQEISGRFMQLIMVFRCN